METLTCKLIKTDNIYKKRYYKLSKPIAKGYNRLLGKIVDINSELIESTEKRVKEEYKHLMPKICDIVCISDANGHDERLVFVGCEYEKNGEYIICKMDIQIEGIHTMSIYGGDSNMCKPDLVYIRQLAKLNGMQFIQSGI